MNEENKLKREIEALKAEIERLKRGLVMLSNHDGIAGIVARRVLRNDGTYK